MTRGEDILAALDDEQREVAEALRGPVRVLAGAGTGKTRAITHRIAYGCTTGAYLPDKVLALTFTSRAAGEMRTRLRELGASDVAAQTFHAAALRQVGHFWPEVTGGRPPHLLEGKARILTDAAREVGVRPDTPTLRDIAAEVEWRKVMNLSLESYPTVAAQTARVMPGSLTLDQMVSLATVYERLKDERNQIDFEDVLLLCAGMIDAEESVAAQVRDRYRFFVVDEYQDVSPLQQYLLDLWLGPRRDLCVVGDASQTIFSFTGATSNFLLQFESNYPQAHTIRLDRNYRSTEPIVQTANRLMHDQPGSLELVSVVSEPKSFPVTVREFASDVLEAQAVAASIAEDIASGVKPEDIAILFRVNAQSAPLEQALGGRGIAHQVHGGTRFYDRTEVKRAILALRGEAVVARDVPLFQRVSDVLRELGWTLEPPATTGAEREAWESLNALVQLADQAPEGQTFRAFTDALLARQSAKHEPTMHAVTLTNIHAAKGLEWKVVYLVGVAEGTLPISYATTDAAIDEERRVLYVGITRAAQKLSVSFARQGGPHATPHGASRFLAELGTRISATGAPPRSSTRRGANQAAPAGG